MLAPRATSDASKLILQRQLFGVLAAVRWAQCLHYQYRLSSFRSVMTLCGFLLTVAGLQVAFVYAVRHGMAGNNTRPLEFFGVMTAILVFGGLMKVFACPSLLCLINGIRVQAAVL